MSTRRNRVPAWDCRKLYEGPGGVSLCRLTKHRFFSSFELCLFYEPPDSEQGVTADPPPKAPRAATRPDQPAPAPDHHPNPFSVFLMCR